MKRKIRPVLIRDGKVLVPLGSRKGIVGYAKVDIEDLELAQGRNWCRTSDGYAITWVPGESDQKAVYLHKLVMPANKQVDHRNRNKLDCRRSNLRYATQSQNNRNVAIRSSTGFRGVLVMKDRQTRTLPVQARIRVNGRIIFLGYYKTREEAARAYDKATWSLKVEDRRFAIRNFPNEKHLVNLRLQKKLYAHAEATESILRASNGQVGTKRRAVA